MRSQASKASSKKGVVKPALKTKSPVKKTVSPKKKKVVSKSVVKGAKKNATKDDATSKTEADTAVDKNEASDNVKAGPSKHNVSSDSPPKKPKKETKESINTSESNVKRNSKNAKNKKSPGKNAGKNEIKNKNVIKNTKTKFSKAKTIVKKRKVSPDTPKKHRFTQGKVISEIDCNDDSSVDSRNTSNDGSNTSKSTEEAETLSRDLEEKNNTNIESEEKTQCSPTSAFSNKNTDSTPIKALPANKSETPKTETERPPKFFTSSRSPRMVDIDVKCLKNSKGNLSVSERFLSLKCETKAYDNNKDNPVSNTLVSQGPEIDVYTFTEKVDSPKSILSDFRSSVNKNVGRVRPIARVKGTVVDKTTESEKKKIPLHRPIEEVVQQLKASIRTEEVTSSPGSIDLISKHSDLKEPEDIPKPIISKSYKMVARKSSVTGKPFSPIKFPDQEPSSQIEDKPNAQASSPTKKAPIKLKKESKANSSDDDFDTLKFSLNTKTFHYSSSDESINDSNDESKESSGSDASKNKKTKNKRYRKIMDGAKRTTSKELKELSKDFVDLKDEDMLLLGNEKPSKRRRKLLSMWNGPKKHRMASLNAIAKVHCLYENESRTHMELGLMRTVERAPIASTSKQPITSKKKEVKPKELEKHETTSESEYESKQEKKDDSSESSDDSPPQRSLRGDPGIRSAGKYWDPKSCTSSSEESELESKKKTSPEKKKITKSPSSSSSSGKSDSDKPPPKMKKTAGVPIKKKRNRSEVVMDLKDMVVQKRMASLNATAILAASYEKRSPKSNKDETTSDSCSDESFSQKPKNGVGSGVKSETKIEEPKKEKDVDEPAVTDRKQKVEVIVNQDTDVTITGVYATHHHEGFCTVSGMQYRISSTSHTQTTATANCEKEGCTREDGARYTPLSALSSMQPPADHGHAHPHPVAELGGLSRRPGCSSAFSAPSPSAHHEPGKPPRSRCEAACADSCTVTSLLPPTLLSSNVRSMSRYYQPAGPLIKEGGADERALAGYHLPHHHAPHPPHPPHPPVLPQYGPYYPEFCYGRYYRPPGPYHLPPPQGEGPMAALGGEPYAPPYYGAPCYQHQHQHRHQHQPRMPYVEYRGCPCPLNACPKNVLIGPATGKAPTGGGPDAPPPGGAFRPKARACALDAAADTHGSGKDPPMEQEPPAAADAPHPCPVPTIGGASPKREMFDVRELRLASDVRAGEPLGPPSPARGSDGVCAPQPPCAAPAARRARLGKAMARRTLAGDDSRRRALAGDDTGLLLAGALPAPPHSRHSDADDDVMAISPPLSAPIDLSSSDERSTPLVDIKKENEGPTFASARNPEAQALREHNSTRTDGTIVGDANKPAKRRYSRTKLEIDMKDTQLEEGCKTNGIGEHVKLIKRRKVSGDQTEPPRVETVAKETKKKTSQPRKTPKSPLAERKTIKRKLESTAASPRAKKILLETTSDENPRVGNGVSAVKDKDDLSSQKSTIKSALLLDNLIRKNSIDRAPEKEPNPAELFLSPVENIAQNCAKKMLNINNNIVENANTVSGVRPDTIAAVSQLIGKKLAHKNACKMDKVDSKVTSNVKSVLKPPTVKTNLKDVRKTLNKGDLKEETQSNGSLEKITPELVTVQRVETQEIVKDKREDITIEESDDDKVTSEDPLELTLVNSGSNDDTAPADSSKESQKVESERSLEVDTKPSAKAKRCKLTSEIKAKNVEKVIKLLVSKRPVIKTDEAALVVEEACASAAPAGGARRRARRGRGAARGERRRRPAPPAAPPAPAPRAPPRWSNGWSWDGDHYLAKVYLNNDSRLDRVARCWPRMAHAGGDRVARGDCVLLRASAARAQPFVARVASLWENQDDGEMMVSLVWYYRPEHTHCGRQPDDAPDEVFASRHRDANSVACIEDKCYVLTFNEYCRYRKRLKAAEEGVTITPTVVPPLPAGEAGPPPAPGDCRLPAAVAPDLVLFCRKVYDFRSKKIHVPNK